MNDPLIERVAREDPAAPGAARRVVAGRDDGAAMLRRLLATIDANDGESLRDIRSNSPSFVGGSPDRGPSRRFAGTVGLVGAVLVVAAVIVVALVTVGHHHTLTGPAKHTVPAGGGRAVRAVPAGSVKVGGAPDALLARGGTLWTVTARNVIRLNAADGRVQARIAAPVEAVGAAATFAAGSVWVAYTGRAQVTRIDPRTDGVTERIPLGDRAGGGGVAFAGGRIWVSRDTSGRGDVVAIDPATNRISGTPVTVGTGPGPLAAGFGSLWVDNTSVTVGKSAPGTAQTAVSRVDPRSRRVGTERFSGVPAVGFGSLWIQSNAPGSITRYDPAATRVVARIGVPRVVGMAFGAGRVWAISYPRSRSSRTFHPIKGTATLTEIDPHTNRVVGKPIRLPVLQPIALAVAGDNLWIADYNSGRLLHFKLKR